MHDLAWWGEPAQGLTEPDPYVWWFAAPALVYVLAIWLAWGLSCFIEPEEEQWLNQ